MGPKQATPAPPQRATWFLTARAPGRLVKVFGGQHKIVSGLGMFGPHRGDVAMSNNDSSVADPFGQIADEFMEAFRQGRSPSVEEFARRYPAHADDIRDI